MVFLTLVCHDRMPWLRPDDAKSRLLELLRWLRTKHQFQLHAWVILDDHLHLLVTDIDGSIPTWVQKLKLRFVRGHPHRPRQVWQKRYWDHLIRDENDLRQHLDYIHHNPVKHGLASLSRDYAWSSFASLVRRGWYASDWRAIADDDGDFGETES